MTTLTDLPVDVLTMIMDTVKNIERAATTIQRVWRGALVRDSPSRGWMKQHYRECRIDGYIMHAERRPENWWLRWVWWWRGRDYGDNNLNLRQY